MNTDIPNYETWEETMKAIANGDITLDEGKQLATKCAEIADRALIATRSSRKKAAANKGNAGRLPEYSATMLGNIEQLRQNDISQIADIDRIKQTMIDCGKAADAVQDDKPVGTTT